MAEATGTSQVCNIHLVVGTRPNIIKVAPLYRVLSQQSWCKVNLIFVQQHGSPNMSTEILEDFGLSAVISLALAQNGYGPRIGEIIENYHKLCEHNRPDIVVVFGDVDVSMATTLAAKRLQVPVAHLEAGLRSGDFSMPEEINRIVIDSVSDLLLAPSEDALHNLIFGEGKTPEEVEFVGNIMIDSLQTTLDPGVQAHLLKEYKLTNGEFAIATFHRPSNVDTRDALESICDLLGWLAERILVFLPLHPRTAVQLQKTGLDQKLEQNPRIRTTPALRYSSFINLIAQAAFVVTDSGGVQEETTYLGVPCLTFRDTTERPVTIRLGTNSLVNRFDVRQRVEALLQRKTVPSSPARIPLWDGATAFRSAAVLNRWWDQLQFKRTLS